MQRVESGPRQPASPSFRPSRVTGGSPFGRGSRRESSRLSRSESLGPTKSETPIARFPVNGAALRARLMAASHRLALSRDATALCALGVLNAMLMTLTWGAWGDPAAHTGYDSLACDGSPGVSFRTSTSAHDGRAARTGARGTRGLDRRRRTWPLDRVWVRTSRGVSLYLARTRWRARRFHPWVRFWPRRLTAPVAFAPDDPLRPRSLRIGSARDPRHAGVPARAVPLLRDGQIVLAGHGGSVHGAGRADPPRVRGRGRRRGDYLAGDAAGRRPRRLRHEAMLLAISRLPSRRRSTARSRVAISPRRAAVREPLPASSVLSGRRRTRCSGTQRAVDGRQLRGALRAVRRSTRLGRRGPRCSWPA